MNKRARKARRMLREHRRHPFLYAHTSSSFKWPPMRHEWHCPRCIAGRQSLDFALRRALGRVATPEPITFDRRLIDGQWRLSRDFDPQEGLKKLSSDYVTVVPAQTWDEMHEDVPPEANENLRRAFQRARDLIRRVEDGTLHDPVDGDIIPND